MTSDLWLNNIEEIYVYNAEEGKVTGVEDIDIEAAAPVYYDLRGPRVANPTNGLYIRLQGTKATKVLF